MPLVVLCGQPCSGKSTMAAKLRELLQAAAHPVHLVDEPSLHLERNSAYQTMVQEKATRGSLKSAVERAISKKTIVILDSLNNIKGYRYELWCVARAAGTRYCMVHVATDTDTCSSWNEARPEGQRYSQAVFQDLAGRFETPDPRNRWDSPLFTLTPGSQDESAVLEAIASAMTGTALQQRQQSQQQQQQPSAVDAGPTQAAAAGNAACGDSSVVDADQRVQLMHKAARGAGMLQPTMATTNPSLTATNLLHDIDQAVQSVVTRVMEVQQLSADAGGGGAGLGGAAGSTSSTVVDLGAAGQLRLDRHVSLAELRRHKRAFLKLATKITFSRLQDPAAAQRLFVDHLRLQLTQQ